MTTAPRPAYRPPYSAAELAALRTYYPTYPVAEILAKLPGRNWQGIQQRAAQLGVIRFRPGSWSEAQLDLLREHYPQGGAAAVAPLVGKSLCRVHSVAAQLGVRVLRRGRPKNGCFTPVVVPARQRPHSRWSPAEVALLRAHYVAGGTAELLPLLPGRTMKQIIQKASRCKLHRVRVVVPKAALPPKPAPEPKAAKPPRPVAPPRPKPERPTKVAKVKPAPKPKAVKLPPPPKPMPKAVKPVVEAPAVKRTVATPIINARQAERRRERDKQERESLTKQIQGLKPDSEGRRIYAQTAARHGGPAAAEAFRAWQAQQKQPKQAA